MDLDCMVGNILAHQTPVTDYWEQEWVCVGTSTFFSVYFVLFEFGQEEYIYTSLM